MYQHMLLTILHISQKTHDFLTNVDSGQRKSAYSFETMVYTTRFYRSEDYSLIELVSFPKISKIIPIRITVFLSSISPPTMSLLQFFCQVLRHTKIPVTISYNLQHKAGIHLCLGTSLLQQYSALFILCLRIVDSLSIINLQKKLSF